MHESVLTQLVLNFSIYLMLKRIPGIEKKKLEENEKKNTGNCQKYYEKKAQ